ncbi:helix-turn-helix domain-containing protein [Flavobacterium sp. N1994]|uniref:helix-turn-helix domain-containing protein n=1 Tax=Flavobacterium sp. N1994 TaxID=2986827 RepID=UPI002221D3F7|nr:helix-turn-helix domain-containing protein [Flavobacterium sp. N1994]
MPTPNETQSNAPTPIGTKSKKSWKEVIFSLVALVHRRKLVELEANYYDNADLKQLFKVCDKTLYRWRKTQQVPYAKIGGKIMYSKQAILGILHERMANRYHPMHIKDYQKRD